MLNWPGKVRLGKVYIRNNYKDCQNVKVFSQGLLKLTCAEQQPHKLTYGDNDHLATTTSDGPPDSGHK
jgi:hypothetical protein